MTARHILRSLSPLAIVMMAAVVLAAAPAGAEIIVDGFDSWNSGSNPVSGIFDASGSDKLVVIVTGEHGFPNNVGGNCTGITYDGVALTQAVDRNPMVVTPDPYLVDQTYNDIWYLDNPATSDGVIVATVSTRGNVTVFSLSGTAAGVGATAISPGNSKSVDLTTTADNSIVIASHGMGGFGNTANVASVGADAPLIETSAQENGSTWDGHVTGYAMVPTAGAGTYSFTGGTLEGSHTIAAEFLPGAPPRNLTLQVDIFTGDTSILADPTRDITINYYQVTSEGDSLDTANWSSLADQDFEGSGPADGSGEGWEEAGGAGSHALAEAFLLGNSTLGASQSISLGQGYDALVGAKDLAFTYRTDSGAIVEGLVEYLFPLAGDVDNDGDTDNADIGKAAGAFTGADGSTSMTWHDGDMDGDGDVDNADIGLIAGRFTGAVSGQAMIPEPVTLSLVGLGALALLRRRRS